MKKSFVVVTFIVSFFCVCPSHAETTDDSVHESDYIDDLPEVCLLNPDDVKEKRRRRESDPQYVKSQKIQKNKIKERQLKEEAYKKVHRILQGTLYRHRNILTDKAARVKVKEDTLSLLRKHYPEGLEIVGDHVHGLFDKVVQDMKNQEKDLYSKDYSYSSKESSPFNYACQGSESRLGRGRTGVTRFAIPKDDSKGVLTKDFFLQVIDQAVIYGAQNINMTKNLSYCLNTRLADRNCEDLTNMADVSLRKEVNKARMHLALSESSFRKNYSMNMGLSVNTAPNYKLTGNWDSYKEVPWQKATKKERSYASKKLKAYAERIAKKCHWDIKRLNRNQKKVITNELRKVRAKHYDQYQTSLSKYPLLQYLNTRNPSRKSIQQASDQLAKNAQAEVNSLMAMRKELEKLKAGEPIPKEMLHLLDYQGIVEGVLMKEPHFCAVATSAVKTRGSAETRRSLATLPILMASFTGVPLILVGAAVASATVTASYVKTANDSFQADRRRRLSQMYSDVELTGVEGLADKHMEIYNNAAMLPLELVGLGLGAKAAKALGIGKGTEQALVQADRIGESSSSSIHKVMSRFRNIKLWRSNQQN